MNDDERDALIYVPGTDDDGLPFDVKQPDFEIVLSTEDIKWVNDVMNNRIEIIEHPSNLEYPEGDNWGGSPDQAWA